MPLYKQPVLPGFHQVSFSHCRLSFEGAHVFRVYLQRFLPRHIEGLLLDKGVLDALCLRCLRKDWVVIDSTLAQFRDLGVMPLG